MVCMRATKGDGTMTMMMIYDGFRAMALDDNTWYYCMV